MRRRPVIILKHSARIREELRATGATSFGMLKFASKHLYQIIHETEHVKAAVYGRYRSRQGAFGFNEGMLVATDMRIIFLDHKPGYTAMDELTYEVVSGVQHTTAGPFAAVTLYTRIGDFTLRYANPRCVKKFVNYVEVRHLDTPENIMPLGAQAGDTHQPFSSR